MRCHQCGSKECCGGEMGKRIAELEEQIAYLKDRMILEGEFIEKARKEAYNGGMELAEAERNRMREALQNIANGDTPWLDGYSETPGECYQKYAKQILEGK